MVKHVFKFGGSCLTGPDSLKLIRERIEEVDLPVVCVFSALKGVTDRLIDLATGAVRRPVDPTALLAEHRAYLNAATSKGRSSAEASLAALEDELRRNLKGIELLGEISLRVLDRVMSFGERATVVLVKALLEGSDLPVRATPDADPGFVTDGVYGDARILPTSDQTLRERYTNDPAVHLVPGFVARSRAGEITTLGRGGTDYSATYLGAVLGATTTLFKDTAGLLTSNPQIVEAPRRIERLHYLDALELAHYGTEAIADKAIVPAMEAGTAIEIRGFRNPEVRSRIDGGEADVLAVTCVRRAVMLDFLGLKGDMLRTLGVLFHSLADIGTYPLLVTEASPRGETSMVLKEADLPRLRRRLEDGRIKETPEITREVSVVSMIGSHMRGRVGMAASIFDCLATHRINILAIAQTASERNVSITVTRSHVDEAVCALHERFIGQAG